MPGMIATLQIDPANDAQLEAAFATLSADVKKLEPGATLYQLVRSKTAPGVFKVLEIYASTDDMKAHGKSEHFRSAWPAIQKLLVAAPELDMFDTVG